MLFASHVRFFAEVLDLYTRAVYNLFVVRKMVSS
jgi:hypothetical protein